MPLIIITGLPSSGKTFRAHQILADLNARLEDERGQSGTRTNAASKRTVQLIASHHASLDTPLDPSQFLNQSQTISRLRDEIYTLASAEKNARAVEFSAIKRALSRDNTVIADAPNYIKGYRYQLWCEAKAAGTRCIVVHVAAREEETRMWNEERLRAWGRGAEVDAAMEIDEKEEIERNRGMQGKDVLGGLMPEGHTAIYGDRVVDDDLIRSISRGSSVDGTFEGSDGEVETQKSQANDTMTLKSLYIHDNVPQNNEDGSISQNSHALSSHTLSKPCEPPTVASITPPTATSAPPYSPSTHKALAMRYEPPSPFTRWDTPLFTVPSSDLHPPYASIYTALFPAPVKPTSKKALSQLAPRPHPRSQTQREQAQQNTSAALDIPSITRDESEAKAEEVRQHAATVLPRAVSSNALQELEATTLLVIKSLLSAARSQQLVDNSGAPSDGGTLTFTMPLATSGSVKGEEETVEVSLDVPTNTPISQPALQRLRRKYTALQRGGLAHRQAYVSGRRAIVEGFVRFLAAEWSHD